VTITHAGFEAFNTHMYGINHRENLITLMRIKKIPILMIKKTRTRQKKIHWKSKKDFQIRTEEPGRRKAQKGGL
jgi:hypothetical protein